MTTQNEQQTRSKRRRSRSSGSPPKPLRQTNYRQLRNPFPTMDVFSADQVEDMHQSALKILEDLGMRVLLP
jgi:trimethylamine--corrinoid protein Co-methyltransferase